MKRKREKSIRSKKSGVVKKNRCNDSKVEKGSDGGKEGGKPGIAKKNGQHFFPGLGGSGPGKTTSAPTAKEETN